MTWSHLIRDRPVMMSSTMPSTKYSCSGSPLILVNGITASDGLSASASGILVGSSAAPVCDSAPFSTRYTRTGRAHPAAGALRARLGGPGVFKGRPGVGRGGGSIRSRRVVLEGGGVFSPAAPQTQEFPDPTGAGVPPPPPLYPFPRHSPPPRQE